METLQDDGLMDALCRHHDSKRYFDPLIDVYRWAKELLRHTSRSLMAGTQLTVRSVP